MLIDRVRAGQTDAYAELVRRYATDAHRAAVFSGAGADAEDVVQIAFVKAYRNLGSFRSESSFRPWLLRIVVNESRNAARAARRRRDATERAVWLAGVPVAADPEAEAVTGALRATLLSAVARLSEPHREVVVCRYFLGLDEREVARTLGLPRGTVKSRLHRALRRLRTELAGGSAAEQEVRHG